MKPQKFKVTQDITKDEKGVKRLREEPINLQNEEKIRVYSESILWKVLKSLYGDNFEFDGITILSIKDEEKKLSVNGKAYWLSKNEDLSIFRLDIAKQTEKLLYSFKFFNEKTNIQKMYIAKTLDGWVVDRECI